MKKFFIILIILMVGVSGVFAVVDITTMEDSFSTFSSDVAESLPFASTIGLNWSDAKVRGFPHFGVGLSVGAVMIPEDAFVALADSFNFSLPSAITDSGYGVPFPAYVIDARIGIPFLPIDIGAKLGVLTPEMSASLSSDVAVDYTLVGFDIRTPIIKGNLVLPAISLSAGYNYLSGGVNASVAGVGDLSSIDLNPVLDTVLSYTDPDIRFAWETHTIDFKLQVSKSLLIITPYAGLGYNYGWSKAGGGISSDIAYSKGETEASVRKALEDAGYDVELSNTGFTIFSEAAGGSFRAFGGLSVNLFILKLDLNAMYNISTQSLGASANVRIAF
ncbi:MAG: hypothetical protein PF693_18925 [Spirochaetia bacterium]|jgi:hypothetical protein|nr:hypothetical protein [Spirochaetia bacterium]